MAGDQRMTPRPSTSSVRRTTVPLRAPKSRVRTVTGTRTSPPSSAPSFPGTTARIVAARRPARRSARSRRARGARRPGERPMAPRSCSSQAAAKSRATAPLAVVGRLPAAHEQQRADHQATIRTPARIRPGQRRAAAPPASERAPAPTQRRARDEQRSGATAGRGVPAGPAASDGHRRVVPGPADAPRRTVSPRAGVTAPRRRRGRTIRAHLTQMADDSLQAAAPPAPREQWRIPAEPSRVPEVRHGVRAFAAAHGAPADVLGNLALAVTEAVTNAILHAYVGIDPGRCPSRRRPGLRSSSSAWPTPGAGCSPDRTARPRDGPADDRPAHHERRHPRAPRRRHRGPHALRRSGRPRARRAGGG
jgi:hypothetical protein